MTLNVGCFAIKSSFNAMWVKADTKFNGLLAEFENLKQECTGNSHSYRKKNI